MGRMIRRTSYLNRLLQLKNEPMIKVVTGPWRAGKSALLESFRAKLQEDGVREEQCIAIDFTEAHWKSLRDSQRLYEYVLNRLSPGRMNYVFLDEVQLAPDFPRVADSLLMSEDVDLYLAGSHASILSDDFQAIFSGRYREIPVLPLSFREYYAEAGGDEEQAFWAYCRHGGFPDAVGLDGQKRGDYLLGLYSTVLLRDVVRKKRLADVPLLEALLRFLATHLGQVMSIKKIADALTQEGKRTTTVTVDSYARALQDAFLLYAAGRYDIRHGQELPSLGKYYLPDLGFRALLVGEHAQERKDIVLENVVYLELLRRGYRVFVGRLGRQEVDFVAERDGDRLYCQVAASLADGDAWKKRFAPLKSIRDNYPKYVLSMEEDAPGEAGIRQRNLIDFLLSD